LGFGNLEEYSEMEVDKEGERGRKERKNGKFRIERINDGRDFFPGSTLFSLSYPHTHSLFLIHLDLP